MISLIKSYAVSLLLTLLIEISFAFIFQVKNKKDFLLITAVNAFTNPIVVTIFNCYYLYYHSRPSYLFILIFELWAVFSEGFFYKKLLCYKLINPYLFSLLLNLLSYIGGIIYEKI